MKEKRRCSILFHLLVPGGRWLTAMSRPTGADHPLPQCLDAEVQAMKLQQLLRRQGRTKIRVAFAHNGQHRLTKYRTQCSVAGPATLARNQPIRPAGAEPIEPGALSKLTAGTVYVKADSRVPFQKVLAVLDALRGKSVVLLAAPPSKNVEGAKIVPPYGIKVIVSR